MQKYSREERIAHLKAWKNKKINGTEYCRQNNIKASTFYSWIKIEKKHQEKVSPVKFVKVPAIQNKRERSDLMIIETGQIKLHLPIDTDIDRLKVILTALSTANAS